MVVVDVVVVVVDIMVVVVKEVIMEINIRKKKKVILIFQFLLN